MAEVKIAAGSGGGSISIKGPSSSGSDVDVLDTSGNLAISGNATITGSASAATGYIGTTSYGGGGSSPTVYISSDSDRALKIHNTTDSTSSLQLTNSGSGQGNDNGLQIALLSSDVAWFNNAENADMRFATNGTEKMRLTAAGFLKAKGDYSAYISDTDNVHEFNGDTSGETSMRVRAGSSNGNGIQCLVNSDDTTNYYFAGRSTSADSARMYIWSNGDLDNNNNSYGSLSDIKLKENIVDASSQWNDIKNIKVRKFNFKDNPSKPMIGLIAQEAETVSPGLVDSHPDTDAAGDDLGTTTKSVKYSILYMKAIKALQEAMAKIETLETKVAALEAG